MEVAMKASQATIMYRPEDVEDKKHSVRFNDHSKDSPLPTIYVPRKTLAQIDWYPGDALVVTLKTGGPDE
jgi:hypothetical protein